MFLSNSWLIADVLPLSQQLSLHSLTDNAKLQLPDLDKNQLSNPAKIINSKKPKQNSIRPLQISQANLINKSIKQLGQWQHINEQSIWRLQISAKDALHLNLGFKQVHLPDSATLFITDANSDEVIKRYSSSNNKPHGELWTPLLNSKSLLLEINLKTADMDELKLTLVQVGQGIKAINPREYTTKASGSCNIDVACPQGDNWRNEIRAVAKYTITTEAGTFLCTGTLINNSRVDLAPFFLTAAHCLVSDTTAASMVFYWNYETSVCDATANGPLDQNQTGATLVSRWEGLDSSDQSAVIGSSDFALVKLDTVPDAGFHVYYSGWDNSAQSHTGATVIHHPQGEEKRISTDLDPLTITLMGEAMEDPIGRFFKVEDWDEGTTEGGSSGAGLWNINHQLIGTLSGGDAACAAPAGSDWFGRLTSHWTGNGFASNQLAIHLSPADNTLTNLNGADSCSAPSVAISVDTNTPAVGQQISFTSTVSGGSGSYIYAWDFNNDGLTDSVEQNPAFTYTSASNNKVTLIVKDSVGCPGYDTHWVLAADTTELYLANGLLPTNYTKPVSAQGTWIVDDGLASEGLFSLKSQVINADNISSIELSGTYQAGDISFDRKVSSETDYDFFKFFIDDIGQFSISGEQDWTNVSYPLTAGSHVFRWSFEKDAGLSIGQDAAWIDNLQFIINKPPAVTSDIPDQDFVERDIVLLDISGNFSDTDNDTLTFNMTGAPASLAINNGIISGTLLETDVSNSPYSIQITADDGQNTITDTFILTVVFAGRPTLVTAIVNQTNIEGDSVSLDISANFVDPDSDPLTFTLANGPANLSIDNNTGVISGNLSASDSAASPYTVNIKASDGVFEIKTTFTWTVNAPPTPIPTPPPNSGGGGGSMGFILLISLVLCNRLIKSNKDSQGIESKCLY